jgi:hypothetical protein
MVRRRRNRGRFDIVTSGDFASATGWTLDTGWTISGGKLIATGALINTSARQGGIGTEKFIAGRRYRVTLTIDSISGSGLQILCEGGGSDFGTGSMTTPGTYTSTGIATASGGLYVWANGTLTAQIDNLSIIAL